MSVVERALKKIRGTERGEAPSTPKPAIGALVSESPAVKTTSASGAAPSTHLRVHVDRAALRASGYMPETGLGRRFADLYRLIKRPLIAKARTDAGEQQASGRLILMASALPGDGKTFTCINLALSMARERDISVLLVDADIPKPHVSRIFGLHDQPGLMEALSDASLDVESLVLPTDVERLSLLPAGKSHDGATELLASARMQALISQLVARDPQRIILFDSPPLLASTESRTLAAFMGQLVLVVRAGLTPRQAVLDALELIGDQPPVSLVLNQARSRGLDQYGDYYYQYGDDAGSAPG